MNFLAHHRISRDPRSWFATGVALPDLRGHAPGSRLDGPAVAHAVARDDAERDLLEGLREHARADAIFHASPAFAAWRRALRPAAREAGAEGAASTLLIHVGIEVALDRLLLLADPGLAASFYALLEPVEPGRLESALAHLCGEQARPVGGAFAELLRRRHLVTWTDPDRAALSLQRVCDAMLRGRSRELEPARVRAFLAAAEAAIEASDYPATGIGAWLTPAAEPPTAAPPAG